MENENSELGPMCRGGDCGFQVADGRFGCSQDGTGCRPVDLLEAEPSAFYDNYMLEATRAINDILAKIPADPDGRVISFIDTNMGTLLAWVDHSGIILENAVTQDDDDATIAAALGLKNVEIAGSAQAN